MWRIARTRCLPALPRGWNGQCRQSMTSVGCAGVAAAAGAALAATTSGSSCSAPMPAIVQKGASEDDMIEGLQMVILDKIESRLTTLERVGIGPPPEQRSAAETDKKAAPEESPTQSNGLVGRRILVTAPSTYATRLAGQVLARGGRPICMPTIVTEPLQEQEHDKLDEALRTMESASASGSQPAFAYIAFTSRNGIEAFLRRAAVLGLADDLAGLLRGCTVCALGNDAKMLEQAGIEVGLLPTVASPKGIIDELEERGESGLGRAILVPVPEVTGVPEPPVVPNFVAGLNKLGMAVHRVPAYATRAVLEGNEVEEALLKGGNVDAIAFSSTAEATALALSLGGAERLREAVKKTVVCCFGPVTAKNVREELGLEVQVVSKNFSSFAGYADALAEYFSTSR